MSVLTPRITGRRRIWFALVVLASAGVPARGEDLDSVMYRDPEVPVARVVKTYPKGLVELWQTALDRPEREMQCRAALAIAAAHEGGTPGLAALAPSLVKLIERPDQHPAVLTAAVRALAVLDARDVAPIFLRLAKSGDPDLCAVVELALARWDHKPARDLWIERIGQPPPYGHSALLAVRCLGTVREERAVPRLRELALSAETLPPVRLAAARAVGDIRTAGSEADAARLAGDATPHGMIGRLVAGSLLRRHDGAEAVRVLQALVRDSEPAVAAMAIVRLAELGTKHVLTVLDPVLKSPDAEVREHGVEAMFRNPSDEYVRSLLRILSDPHPGVRVRARKALHELAGDRRAGVIEGSMKLLAGDWRGQEQAAILLGQLGHKPAAEPFVRLLTANRGEVIVAAAWGLRQLAVPETLPKVLDHIVLRHQGMLRSGPTAGLPGITGEALDRHLSQLIQFVGQARYRAADPALQALIPRLFSAGPPPVFTPVGPETRAAAIWALGLFREGKTDEKLATQIEGRIIGDGMYGSDDERVRRMSALALWRMQAKQSLPTLRAFSEGKEPSVLVGVNACRIAVARLTGEPLAVPGTVEKLQLDWFLAPAK